MTHLFTFTRWCQLEARACAQAAVECLVAHHVGRPYCQWPHWEDT